MKASRVVSIVIALLVLLSIPVGAAPKPPKTQMDTPVISCGAGATQTSINLQVCAGATTGAPAGFSVQSAGGNGLIALAHQLIAAKLNVANGADDTAVAGAIVSADALIGGLVVPPVGSGSLAPSATSALTTTLTNFNEGAIGPGHCE